MTVDGLPEFEVIVPPLGFDEILSDLRLIGVTVRTRVNRNIRDDGSKVCLICAYVTPLISH